MDAAISRVQEFKQGKDFAEYDTTVMLRSAVERALTIAGEAAAQIRRHFPEYAQRSDEMRRIVDLRNVLTHQYHEVDDRLVWSVIQGPIVDLQRLVRAWLHEIDAS